MQRSRRPPLAYLVIATLLFAGWVVLAVALAVTFALEARDNDEPDTAAPTATSTIPAPTPTPAPRPGLVPLTATPVDGAFDTGEPAQHLFFDVACSDGVLVVITTDERIYAEFPCGPPTPAALAPLRGQPVRLTLDEGRLEVSAANGARLSFPVGRAWVDE